MENEPGNIVNRIFERILSIGTMLACILLIFIMFAISFDVILRYSVNHPLEWVVEISQYSLVGITFFAASLMARETFWIYCS